MIRIQTLHYRPILLQVTAAQLHQTNLLLLLGAFSWLKSWFRVEVSFPHTQWLLPPTILYKEVVINSL